MARLSLVSAGGTSASALAAAKMALVKIINGAAARRSSAAWRRSLISSHHHLGIGGAAARRPRQRQLGGWHQRQLSASKRHLWRNVAWRPRARRRHRQLGAQRHRVIISWPRIGIAARRVGGVIRGKK